MHLAQFGNNLYNRVMTKASYVSLTLARFETLTEAGSIQDVGTDGVLYSAIGTDSRAAGTKFSSGKAYAFVVLGLHSSAESAHAFVDHRSQAVPWLDSAFEVWSGVLRPVRHVGESNFLDSANHSLIYDCPAEAAPEGPFIVLTTAGFEASDDYTERVGEFSTLVNAVRTSMTAIPGLHSQQSFMLNKGLETDGMTVTFWQDFTSMRNFAYGPGVHRDNVVRQKAEKLANRTSFTRLVIEHSEGSWRGFGLQ